MRLPEIPAPLREIACGLPAVLLVIESVPVTLPVVLGVKATLMVQLAPARGPEEQSNLRPSRYPQLPQTLPLALAFDA